MKNFNFSKIDANSLIFQDEIRSVDDDSFVFDCIGYVHRNKFYDNSNLSLYSKSKFSYSYENGRLNLHIGKDSELFNQISNLEFRILEKFRKDYLPQESHVFEMCSLIRNEKSVIIRLGKSDKELDFISVNGNGYRYSNLDNRSFIEILDRNIEAEIFFKIKCILVMPYKDRYLYGLKIKVDSLKFI